MEILAAGEDPRRITARALERIKDVFYEISRTVEWRLRPRIYYAAPCYINLNRATPERGVLSR